MPHDPEPAPVIDGDPGGGLVLQVVQQERQGVRSEGDQRLQALGRLESVVGQEQGPGPALAGEWGECLAAQGRRQAEVGVLQGGQAGDHALDPLALGFGDGRPGGQAQVGHLAEVDRSVGLFPPLLTRPPRDGRALSVSPHTPRREGRSGRGRQAGPFDG